MIRFFRLLSFLLQRIQIGQALLYLDPQAGDDPSMDGDPVANGDPGEGDPAGGGDPGTGDEFVIPEKFLVKADDGTVNHQETMRKMMGSYTHLEKRVGTGDIPPATADEYKLERYLPEGYEEKPEAMKPILAKMHGLKLTNAQLQGVMNLFGETLSAGLAQDKAAHEAGIATLKQEWGEEYEKNLNLATSAVAAYGTPELRQEIQNSKLRNDPLFIRFASAVGADLHREGDLPNDLENAGGETLETLRAHPAYMDATHPEHGDILRKVNALYAKGAKSRV